MVSAAPRTSLAPPLMYWIDAADRICDLNEAYIRDVAGHNPVADIRAALIGTVMWQVLPQAADWYGPLVRRVREDGREVVFQFRCDTPDMRRLMRMRISPEAEGGVCFESATIAVQERPVVALIAEPLTGRDGAPVTMCSWCKRVDIRGEWLEVELALDRIRLADGPTLPPVTHGVCPRCLHELAALAESPDAALSIDLPPASPE